MGTPPEGSDPPLLWLLPIHLRSRTAYYTEALEAAEEEVAVAREQYAHLYDNPQEFEDSSYLKHVWRRHSPYWWGLNDVVGWVDIRLWVEGPAIRATLFTTKKRASRSLTDRRVVFRRHVDVPWSKSSTSSELQEALIQAVQGLADDPSVRKRFFDRTSWEQVVRHTNVAALIRTLLVHADESTASGAV